VNEPRSYWGVVPGEVLHDRELTSAAKLLYLVLSSMAGRDGYCWPSNETLSVELDLSKRRVRELLARLQERGYIRVDVRRSEETNEVERRYIYCGLFVGEKAPAPSGGELPDPPAGNRHPSGEISPDPPAKSRTCIIGRNIKKENIPPIVPHDIFSLCETYAVGDRELLEAILGLLENRAALKKPVKTARAMKGILRQLDKHSGGDRVVKLLLLEKATMLNWLTVYPLKPDERAAPRRVVDEEDLPEW